MDVGAERLSHNTCNHSDPFSVLQRSKVGAAVELPKPSMRHACIRQRLSEAEQGRQVLAEGLAQREGRELYASTEPSEGEIRRGFWQVERVNETARAKALAFVAGAKSLVLVSGDQPAGVLLACSADSGIDAGTILKQTLAEFGGRGGGSATLAQGSVPGADCLSALSKRLGMN